MAVTTATPTAESTRRISFSQEAFSLVDEFADDVQRHAMQALQEPGLFPERQMLQVLLTDYTNLKAALQRGVIE